MTGSLRTLFAAFAEWDIFAVPHLTTESCLYRITSMVQPNYERLKEALDREYKLNLEALERVRRIEESLAGSASDSPANGKKIASASRARPRSNPETPRKSGGKLISAVREIVRRLEGEFTRQTIENALKADHPELKLPKGSMKAVLKRMVGNGEIKLLLAAQGRRYAKYQRGTLEE